MMRNHYFKWFKVVVSYIWLGLFAFVPHFFIFLSSFLKEHQTQLTLNALVGSNYYTVLCNPLYLKVFWRSLRLATGCTLICLVTAYPFAYSLAQIKGFYKNFLVALVLVPFWTSSLIRTYAIVALFKTEGILNTALISLGFIHQPLQLLYTQTAVMIGLTYDLLPFMILPLYNSFEKLDQNYVRAARDLGANSWTVLTRLLIPLTWSGICTGSLLVFLPAMTLFHIPDILGGAKSLLLGNLIQQQFLMGHWGLGGALSTTLLGLLLCILRLGQWIQNRKTFIKNSTSHV